MKPFLILLFGLLSQAILCLAVISLFDGGTFFTESGNHGLTGTDGRSALHQTKPIVCTNPTALTILRYGRYGQCAASQPGRQLQRIDEPVATKANVLEAGDSASDAKATKAKTQTLPKAPSEQTKPYIVKAVPKSEEQHLGEVVELEEGADGPIEEIEEVASSDTTEKVEDKEVQTEAPEDLGIKESAVEEEMLDTPPKADDVISFSQWAEKQSDTAPVKETEKQTDAPQTVPKANVLKSSSVKLTKNFASPDCTAKITGANPESQGSGNVISSSRDEYLLNKCVDRAYFVVELCESIKALKVQIANFELYSSSPREFRVSIGNAYPGREKDWVEFGTFTYQDERSIQSFKNEAGVLGKFAKVEILSHHGAEHYCPISMFKVYGIPEIDLISGEVDDGDDQDDSDDSQHIEEKGNENPIVKSVKTIGDVFVTMIRNVVFKTAKNSSISVDLNSSSLYGSSMRHVLLTGVSGMAQDRLDLLTYLLSTQYATIRRYLYTMPVKNVLLENCCERYGISFPMASTAIHQSWRWLEFLKVVHGEDFILALCNVLSIELGLSEIASTTVPPVLKETNFILVNTSTSNKNISAPGNPSTPDREVHGKLKHSQTNDQTQDRNKNSTVTHREDTIDRDKKEEQADSSETSATGEQNKEQKEKNGGASASTATTTAAAAGRETTWQKLSNRIRSLERNVSLSTGFLEELSLKYIKQIDELNTAVKMMSESIAVLTKKEEACKSKWTQLEKQVETLTKNLDGLETRLGETQEEMMSRHGLLVLLEVCLLGLILFWCSPSGKQGERVPSSNGGASRRLSLDTLKDAKIINKSKEEKIPNQRRKSIEVGTLCNGQIGSMIEPLQTKESTSRKLRRRKKRREGRISSDYLKNVDEEEDEDSVYMTFHGIQEIDEQGARKRSSSWNDLTQDPSSEVGRRDHQHGADDPGQPDLQASSDRLASTRLDRPQRWENHVSDVIKSTRFLVSQVAPEVERNEELQRSFGRQSTPPRSRELPSERYESSPRVVHSIKISNLYAVLNNSVHEVDSETDTDHREGKSSNSREFFGKKVHRSKSTSPTRQANMLHKQKVLFKNFRPEEAEWLQ